MISRIKSFLFGGTSRSVTMKKNIIGSLVIKFVSIVVQLMLVPITLGYLSSELYGIWLTLSSVILWLGFFDIGFTLGLKNKLAESIANNNFERGRRLVSTTYGIMIIIFIPLMIILEFIVPYIDWCKLLNVNPCYSEDVAKAMMVLVACFCLQMITNVLSTILSAYQKVALSSIFPVISNVISLIIIYALTKFVTASLFYLAVSISFIPVLIAIISSFYFFNGEFNYLSPKVSYYDKTLIKDLFNLGLKFFIIQIQALVLYQATNVLISNLAGPEEVTNYNIAYRYLGVATMFFSIILTPLWPAFTDAYTKKDFVWMEAIYKKMTRIVILSIIMMVIMVIASPLIYRIWIGDKVIVPITMIIIVAIYMVVLMWVNMHVIMINGIGAVKLQSYIVLFGLIFHIPMSIFLSFYFGAIGVVLSMLIINIVYSIVFTIQLRKILKQKATGIWLK